MKNSHLILKAKEVCKDWRHEYNDASPWLFSVLGRQEQWEVEGKGDSKGSVAAIVFMSQGQAWFITM